MAVIALIETAGGDVAAVQFPSRDIADTWADARGIEVLSVRPLVTRSQVARLVAGEEE